MDQQQKFHFRTAMVPRDTTDASSSPKLSKWLRVGYGAFFVASVCGLLAIVTKAVQMIQDGRGLETYRTTWLVEFSWIGILASLGSAVVAVLLTTAYRWWANRRDLRELEQLNRSRKNSNLKSGKSR
jgi:hypothetical protein